MRTRPRLIKALAAGALLLAMTVAAAGAISPTDPDPPLTRGAPRIFMTLDGEVQGTIEGSVTQAGREGSIEIKGVNHGASIDGGVDALSPVAVHEPFVVLKAVDQSTPALWQALFDNENLPSVLLSFWVLERSGKELMYFTVELTDAQIVAMSMLNDADTGTAVVEDIRFVYTDITWTWEANGATHTETWSDGVEPASDGL